MQYCPTHNMLADYFTKPLQGATFCKFRNTIMNCHFGHSDVHLSNHRSVLDRERANAQSHSTVPRLPQIESVGRKALTQSKGMKMLTQQQEKVGKNQGPSHF